MLDELFRTNDGRFMVVEAKGGTGRKGKTKRGTVPQFSPEWFGDRLDELRLLGQGGLADDLEAAWRNGRLEAYEVYTDTEATAIDISEKKRLKARKEFLKDPDSGNLGKGRPGRRAGRVSKVVDRTSDWNDYIRQAYPSSASGGGETDGGGTQRRASSQPRKDRHAGVIAWALNADPALGVFGFPEVLAVYAMCRMWSEAAGAPTARGAWSDCLRDHLHSLRGLLSAAAQSGLKRKLAWPRSDQERVHRSMNISDVTKGEIHDRGPRPAGRCAGRRTGALGGIEAARRLA